MITGRSPFNLYFCCALLALACGCHGKKDEKDEQFSTLRLHMEVIRDTLDFSVPALIFRANPVSVNVDKRAFLTETDVAEARVIEESSGWRMQIQLNRRGSWILEQQTTSNPGKHIAIFSEFGHKPKQARWLAAPVFTHRVGTGLLSFTPDATREEADEIALGLNNLAKKVEKQSKW